MIKIVSLHLCSEQPQKLAAFYQTLLSVEPPWAHEDVIGFMIGDFRLEIMKHSEVSGTNQQPQRIFFDLQVDDVQIAFAQMMEIGATAVQEPYHYADEEVSFTLATLADIDGNYFQLVAMEEATS